MRRMIENNIIRNFTKSNEKIYIDGKFIIIEVISKKEITSFAKASVDHELVSSNPFAS